MAGDVAVLIVDDSALMRNLIGRMVEATPGLVVAEKAMNGVFALQKIPRVEPDVIVLDLEMPEMNGIEFLKERRKRGIEIPVVILSSSAARGAEITIEALALGASDFIQKPSGSISEDIRAVKDTLTGMLLAYGGAFRRRRAFSHAQAGALPQTLGDKAPGAAPGAGDKAPGAAGTLEKIPGAAAPAKAAGGEKKPATPAPVPARKPGKTEIIALGISTGGPDALRTMFAALDADLAVPIVVVQHMPAGFTAEFARSLNRICPLEVKEATDGDALTPGRVLIAQGDRHLEVARGAAGGVARVSEAPQVSGHRPSVDVLFASVGLVYRNHALGVIMTGMGRDGAQQLGTIYKEGGLTLGQDEATSVVYGMPRVAYEMGHVMEQVPLERMARRICDLAKAGRQP